MMAESGDMRRVESGRQRVGGSLVPPAAHLPRSGRTGGCAPDADADTAVSAPAAFDINEESPARVPAPALRFDWTDWLPYLEDQDVPEEQKRELIETLWSIVISFVDLGWQVNSKAEFSGEALDLKAILTAADKGNGKEAV